MKLEAESLLTPTPSSQFMFISSNFILCTFLVCLLLPLRVNSRKCVCTYVYVAVVDILPDCVLAWFRYV